MHDLAYGDPCKTNIYLKYVLIYIIITYIHIISDYTKLEKWINYQA